MEEATAGFSPRSGLADMAVHLVMQATRQDPQPGGAGYSPGIWDLGQALMWMLLIAYTTMLGVVVLAALIFVRIMFMLLFWMAAQAKAASTSPCEAQQIDKVMLELCLLARLSPNLSPLLLLTCGSFKSALRVALHALTLRCKWRSWYKPWDAGVLKAMVATAVATYCMATAPAAPALGLGKFMLRIFFYLWLFFPTRETFNSLVLVCAAAGHARDLRGLMLLPAFAAWDYTLKLRQSKLSWNWTPLHNTMIYKRPVGLYQVLIGALSVPVLVSLLMPAGYMPVRDCWLAAAVVIGAAATWEALSFTLKIATHYGLYCAVLMAMLCCNKFGKLLLLPVVCAWKVLVFVGKAVWMILKGAVVAVQNSWWFVGQVFLTLGAWEASLVERYKAKMMIWRYQQQHQRLRGSGVQKRTSRCHGSWLQLLLPTGIFTAATASSNSNSRRGNRTQQKQKQQQPARKPDIRKAPEPATLKHVQPAEQSEPQLSLPGASSMSSQASTSSSKSSKNGSRGKSSSRSPSPTAITAKHKVGPTKSTDLLVSIADATAAPVIASPPSQPGQMGKLSLPKAKSQTLKAASKQTGKKPDASLAAEGAASVKPGVTVAAADACASRNTTTGPTGAPRPKSLSTRTATLKPRPPPPPAATPSPKLQQGNTQASATQSAAKDRLATGPGHPELLTAHNSYCYSSPHNMSPWSPQLQPGSSSSSSNSSSSGSSSSAWLGPSGWQPPSPSASEDDPWSLPSPTNNAAATAVVAAGSAAAAPPESAAADTPVSTSRFTSLACRSLFQADQVPSQDEAAISVEHSQHQQQQASPRSNSSSSGGSGGSYGITSSSSSTSRGGRLCVVCGAAAATYMLAHHNKKGHLCLCGGCCAAFDHQHMGCPVCNEPVQRMVQVFGRT